MKKLTLVVSMLLLLASSAVVGCDFAVTGSGNLQARDMDFNGFDAVEIGDFFVVDIIQSDSYKVSITVDDNIFKYLDISQDGRTLRIGLKKALRSYKNITLKAEITMPQIQRLVMSTETTGTIRGFNIKHDFELMLSEFSSLNFSDMATKNLSLVLADKSQVNGDITVEDVILKISKFSEVRLVGSATNLVATVSDVSSLELARFVVNNANVTLSDFSAASLNLTGRLDAQLRDSSNLFYTGTPTVGSIYVDDFSRITHE